VKDDVKKLMETFESVHPFVGSISELRIIILLYYFNFESYLAHNNGDQSKVLLLNGTMPITYQSAKVNNDMVNISLF